MFLPEWYLPNGIKNANEGALEAASSSCERCSIWCAAVVVVFVVVEFVIAIFHPPYNSTLERWGSATADFFIAAGIVGEVMLGILDSRIQTELRTRSNAKVQAAAVAAGEANERAAKADLARTELEARLAARSLTKEQFEILKKLQGKISEVIIASERDAEPAWFATVLATALTKIGIKVELLTRGPGVSGTANFICDRRAFVNPDGEPTKGEPLRSILIEAGIPIPGLAARYPGDLCSNPADQGDVPMVVISGRFAVEPNEPYLGPNEVAPPTTMVERMRNP